jgi:hypothetical protein
MIVSPDTSVPPSTTTPPRYSSLDKTRAVSHLAILKRSLVKLPAKVLGECVGVLRQVAQRLKMLSNAHTSLHESVEKCQEDVVCDNL